MRTDDSKKPSWVIYLEGDVLGKETKAGFRVYQLVIRVKAEGLLAVVKARKSAQYEVCFVGAGSLSLLAAGVRDAVGGVGKKWQSDAYPPT